ncbi:MAG: sulfite exporter TauE/SafE family protein, partial [Sphingobacteriales bacterium]
MSNEIIILCIAAFAAGFIDSIVGGGGLVQTPATLVTLPQYPIATLLGTTKIPSFTGTAIACFQYAKRVSLHWKLLLAMTIIALLAAMAGSYTVSVVSNRFMKPVIFCVLIIVAIYTYTKKDFGTAVTKQLFIKKEIQFGIISA